MPCGAVMARSAHGATILAKLIEIGAHGAGRQQLAAFHCPFPWAKAYAEGNLGLGRQLEDVVATIPCQIAGRIVLMRALHDGDEAGLSAVVEAAEQGRANLLVSVFAERNRWRIASPVNVSGNVFSMASSSIGARPIQLPALHADIPQHASYIADWLKPLKQDKREIFRAARTRRRS